MEIEHYLTLLLTLKFQSFYSTVDLSENYFMLVNDVTVISSGTKSLDGSSLKTTSVQIYGTFCKITGLKWSEVKSLSHVRLFATPWTIAYHAPQSMEFSKQEYWSGLPFSSPGDLPNPGIKPWSPTLQADALLSKPPGKPIFLLSAFYVPSSMLSSGI